MDYSSFSRDSICYFQDKYFGLKGINNRMKLTSLFGSKKTKELKEPEVRHSRDSKAGKVILHFDEFMDSDMKQRIKKNIRPLELMDKTKIFEYWYIPYRKSMGWVIIDPKKSKAYTNEYTTLDPEKLKDPFYVEWQRPDATDIVIGECMDDRFAVSERIKKNPFIRGIDPRGIWFTRKN